MQKKFKDKTEKERHEYHSQNQEQKGQLSCSKCQFKAKTNQKLYIHIVMKRFKANYTEANFKKKNVVMTILT